MGNGFKRMTDFSPLSMKNLNDQLERLWLKVMGGISYKDLDSGMHTVIDGKTDEEQVVSIVNQSREEILLAVGSGGGDNLIRNGNWEFGNDSWNCQNAVLEGDYMHIKMGSIAQEAIRAEAGKIYTFGFDGHCNTDSFAYVYGVYPTGNSDLLVTRELNANVDVETYIVSVTVPMGVTSCYVKLESQGSLYVRRIFFREGENVGRYTSNPNEMKGSGLIITENNVSISTPSFNLGILNEDGKTTSVLSAEGTGFDTVQCNNMTIIDRPYVENNEQHIYVNSDGGNDANSGDSTYYPFKTIGRALKAVALHLRKECTIHLTGGTYIEDIDFDYGGTGVLTINGESCTLNGHIMAKGCGYQLRIKNMKIYTRDNFCFLGDGYGCYTELTNCVLDGNGGSLAYGIKIVNGFGMYLKNCEFNNCYTAIYCGRGSQLSVMDCKGDRNSISVCADDLGIINSYGTVPMGDLISTEDNGGRIDGIIISGDIGTSYEDPRATIKTAVFTPKTYFTYTGTNMQSGILKQGKGNGAFIVFDTGVIANMLTGKLIKGVRLKVKRSGNDSSAGESILKGFSHNVSSTSDSFSYKDGYGDMAAIKRGEEAQIDIPVNIIEGMILNTVKGILFYDNSDDKSYILELSTDYDMAMEVLYV